MNKLTLIALVALSVAGCSTGSKDSAPKGSASPGASGAAASTGTGKAAAAAKVIKIAKLGLQGSAPGETEEPLIGDGDPIMIAAGGFTVNVSAAKPTDPAKIADEQEVAKTFNAKNVKTETLPDGWAVTFQNTGSAGDNFFVSVRRDIGGKPYMCETTQNNVEQQKKSLDFCKSLSK